MIRHRRKKSEQGIALVTTLGILAVVSLLAASAVVLSQYAEKDSYTFSSFTRSSYIAEGAANRLYWLILNDRKNIRSGTLMSATMPCRMMRNAIWRMGRRGCLRTITAKKSNMKSAMPSAVWMSPGVCRNGI